MPQIAFSGLGRFYFVNLEIAMFKAITNKRKLLRVWFGAGAKLRVNKIF